MHCFQKNAQEEQQRVQTVLDRMTDEVNIAIGRARRGIKEIYGDAFGGLTRIYRWKDIKNHIRYIVADMDVEGGG